VQPLAVGIADINHRTASGRSRRAEYIGRMTPAEFKGRLRLLGLTTVTAADALKVSRFSIASWQIGLRRIPDLVGVALDELEAKSRSSKR
jgi:hypothetical protein